MVDLHLHLLPGIDDGPPDNAAALRLATALANDGITAAAVTPHVSERYPNTLEVIATATDRFRDQLQRTGSTLQISTGAELALDRIARVSDDELVGFSLGGHGRHLLLECPHAAWPFDIELHVARIAALGMQTVVAHPERCAAVQADSVPLQRLVETGVLVQVTAASLAGLAGRGARRCARELLAAGALHMLSSDAHGAERRPPRMAAAKAVIDDAELAEWLTQDVPFAIFSGGEIPPRPPAAATPRAAGARGRRNPAAALLQRLSR